MTNIIETRVPSRGAGQKSVAGLAVAPIETVKVGFIGVGNRGQAALQRWCHIPFAKITAICDVSRDSIEQAKHVLQDHGVHNVKVYNSFEAVCNSDVNLIYICTDWESHYSVAHCALTHGKHVAIEVPAVLTLHDCWQLIDLAEREQLHCMMLENCCYDAFELSTRAMTKAGLFGEIVHVEGAYFHQLGKNWTDWRLTYNAHHRGDIYPTHGFGPICRVLDIHRSDWLDFLVSVDTNSFNGVAKWREMMPQEQGGFANGDQTSTLIRTRRGKSILLQHDVLSPRPYSRQYRIVGTKGYASKYPIHELYFDDGPCSDEACEALLEKYLPTEIKDIRETALRADNNRGGIAYMMDYRLAQHLHEGKPLDMDVYDLAEWCAIAELTRLSLDNGSVPVKIPDFTRQ